MLDVDKILNEAGLTNPHVHEYVRHWAAHTEPARIEVVSAADDARLIEEGLAAGEILPAGEGIYYSRSPYEDAARSQERTIVATSRPSDKGVYDNWRLTSEIRPFVEGHMKGAMAGTDDVRHPVPHGSSGSPSSRTPRASS